MSKQLKVERELKFAYSGNERNCKFNLEVLHHLESASKALLVQDSVKASLLISDSIKLLKERNKKIRITDSSEGGWLTVKHYECNAVALDLEGDKRISAAEREALRVKTRARARRQNAERMQGRYPPFSQPYSFLRQSQRSKFSPSTSPRYQQPPDFCNSQRGGSPVLLLLRTLDGESVPSDWPGPSLPETPFTPPERIPVRPPHAS